MINKETNYFLILALLFLLVIPLVKSGDVPAGGRSVDGCNEGCAASGVGRFNNYCYENQPNPWDTRADLIITCDCSLVPGGLSGGGEGVIRRIYRGDEIQTSYYCCGNTIKEYHTGNCHDEYDEGGKANFDHWHDAPVYNPPSSDYECFDPDGVVSCIPTPFSPTRTWINAHPFSITPDYDITCYYSENAGWRNKITGAVLPYNSGQSVADCGTHGSGGTGGNGPATSGLCGASGCSITLIGSFIRLDVPQNALEGTGTIVTTNNAFTGTVITIVEENPSFYVNENNILLSAYEIMPQGLAFAIPASITIGYDESSEINEDRLDIYLYNAENNEWVAQNAAHDKENNLLSAYIGHLGTYAVMMPVDTEPPVTEDNYQYNNTWVNKDALIALSATDDLSGVKETLYCIGNNACAPNAIYAEPIPITSEGITYLRYYSADNADNKEAIKETTIKIDKTAPTLNLILNPNVIWPPNHKEVDVKVEGYAVDYLSGVKINNFKLIDEYNEVKNTVNGFNTSVKLIAWRDGSDSDGRNYTITAESTDNAGNTAVTSAVVLVPHDMGK